MTPLDDEEMGIKTNEHNDFLHELQCHMSYQVTMRIPGLRLQEQ
jgi:hypothetical protein